MGAEDKLVFDRWLSSLKSCALGIDYDVRVGPGVAVPADTAPDMSRDWQLLTQLRIDAVIYWERVTWLVEVKPRLVPSALGQLLSYGYWWEREQSEGFPVQLVCMVERTDAQLEPVFLRWGISVVVT